MDDSALEAEARSFAADLAATLEGALGSAHEVSVTVLEGRISVRPADPAGVPLAADSDGETFMRLNFRYSRTWDGHGQFLAVQDSEVHVLSAWDADPLFRYEFVKRPDGGIPAAHLQIHAHRDAIAYAMGYPGSGSRRARRRLKTADAVPHLSALHFPLGGTRFRPSIEDVLQMLIEEFGVRASHQWRVALQAGRARWRKLQLQSAVRDDLEVAADVLRLHGYRVDRERSDLPATGAQLLQY